MSWKKVGGIDYSKSHQNVRIHNSTMSLASVINQFGETGTNTRVCSNLVLDSSASFLSYKNELDTTNLALYYKFDQKVDNSGNNTYTDTRQFTSNPLYFEDSSFSEVGLDQSDGSYNVVPEIFDVSSNLTFKKYLRFHKYSKMLVSNDVLDFNDFVTDPSSNHHEDNFSFTMNCWVYYDVEVSEQDPNTAINPIDGFLLFAIDDDDRSGATNDTSNNPGLYLWAPGYQQQVPQIFYGATSNNNSNIATNSLHEICNDNVSIRYNNWNMITLTVDGKDCKVFVNGELCGDYTFPNKIPKNKITINGNRFIQFGGDWLSETRTSNMDVSISDMKIYSSAFHPYFIKKYYEHDLPHFEQKNHFLINNQFACFGNDLVVQKELFVNSKSHFYEDVVTHGVTEMFNSLSVTGDVAIGSLNPREKLDVMGNIRASGNLHLGYEDISTNGIYFQSVDNTCLEERILDTSGNSELLLFKGDDICGNNVIGDRIRIKAPTIYFDTYDVSGTNKNTEQVKVAINQSGNMGIGVLHPTEKLDVSGKVRLLSETNNNMYIFNGDTCDVNNDGSGNIGFGANVFSDVSFAGISNIAIGNDSQLSEETVSNNISMGNNSLRSNIDGNNNISIGVDAFRDKIGGSDNIAIGNLAGSNLIELPNDISYNLGVYLNAYNTSSENIFIGNNTGYSYNSDAHGATAYNNSIAIGHNSTISQSNSIIIGDSSNNAVTVGINTNIPKYELDVNGAINCGELLVNGKRFGSNDVGGTTVEGDYDISGNLEVEENTFVYKRFVVADKSQDYFNTIESTTYNEDHNYDFIVYDRNIKLRNAPYAPTLSNPSTAISNSLGKPKPLLIDSYDISFVYIGKRVDEGLSSEIKPLFHIVNHDTLFDNDVTFGPSAEILALADASFNENVYIEKHFTVDGDVSFNSNLDVSGSTTVHTDLTVDRYVGLGKIPDSNYTLDVLGNTNMVGSLDISGNTTITGNTMIKGNFYVDGSFNMNNIIYNKQIIETHQVVMFTEQVDISNNGGSTALKVTQYGTTDASGVIAEFFDGDSGLAFKIGNNGKTELHGNMSINKTPDTNYSLDVSGNTNMFGSLGFNRSGNDPRCTIDCGYYNDAILLPRGDDTVNDRPAASEDHLGMIRYNTTLNSLETCGKNSAVQDAWMHVSSGGTVVSENKKSFIAMNEDVNDVNLPSYITLGTDNKCISTIDACGNFALAEGIDNVNKPTVNDYFTPKARFHIRDLTGQSDLPAMRFELNNDASANTIIQSRSVSGGQALDFETNYYNGSTYNYQQALSILPNGHIGIGTQDLGTDANLEISNTTSNCYVNIVSNTDSSSQLRLFDSRDTNGAFVEHLNDQMNLGMFRNSGKQNYLTLKSTGNGADDFRIGVGTTEPKGKFQINDTPSNAHSYVFDNSAALLIHHPTNIDIPTNFTNGEDIQTMMYFTRDISGTAMSLANIRLGSDHINNSVLDFGLFNKLTPNEATEYNDSSNDFGEDVPLVLRLKSSGQVGINIKHPNPDSALHVDRGHIYVGNNNNVDNWGIVFNSSADNNNKSRIVPYFDSNGTGTYDLKTIVNGNTICNFRSENNTNNKYVHMDANVGIGDDTGIDTSSSSLKVGGNVTIGSGYAGSGFDGEANGLLVQGNVNIGANTAGNVSNIRLNIDDNFHVKNDGNVGIGTDDPSSKLSVYDSTDNTTIANSKLLARFEDKLDLNAWTGIGLGGYLEGTSKSAIIHERTDENGIGKLHLCTQNTSDTSDSALADARLTIDAGGNVGIGTDNPSQLLTVKNSGDGEMYITGNSISSAAGYDSVTGEPSNWGNLEIKAGFMQTTGQQSLYRINGWNDTSSGNDGTSGSHQFYTNDTEQMRINFAGNVGIGTTGPSGKLHIYESTGTSEGADGVGSLVIEHGNNAGHSSIVFPSAANRTSDYGYIRYQDDINDATTPGTPESALLTIGTQNDSDDNIALMPSGNVGIGKTDPGEKLDVTGNIKCSGNVTADSFIAVSDRKLKQNIVPIESALDKVCRLEGVHYEFKNTPDVKRMGLIAQDVEKIIPEVVSENNEGIKGIDYGPIVSILIESIKELKEENKKLNKKIDDMQK